MSCSQRMELVDKESPEISISRQCSLLGVHRSGLYRDRSSGENAYNRELMQLIDQQYLDMPCYGSRKMTAWLRQVGSQVNRKRIQRLMRLMGIEAIYQKPNTSKPHPEHKIYPYLLRGMKIDRPNQVWAADITYIPMPKGFLYLVAIIDWFSRKVLSWRLSNTMEADFCVEALNEALIMFDKPEIFNTDQGSQFTSQAFTGVLKSHGVKISMDGRGRFVDNIFVERLWRSLKYENVYLHAYATGSEAKRGVGEWFRKYNSIRLHEALGYRTPDQVYVGLDIEDNQLVPTKQKYNGLPFGQDFFRHSKIYHPVNKERGTEVQKLPHLGHRLGES
jgi:putative transposase